MTNAVAGKNALRTFVAIGTLCAGLLWTGYAFGQSPNTFSFTGSMSQGRDTATATLLNNGMVLITGGFGSGAEGSPLSSAALYNPATGTFTATGSMAAATAWHTATLLNNGNVLIVGGYGNSGALSTAELYNPSTNAFTPTGNLNTPRYYHTATLLNNGMVLITGGKNDSIVDSVSLSSAEIYNPSTGTFTDTGSLNQTRSAHTATLLSDGTVLVAGGNSDAGPRNSAELYNPSTGTFTNTGSLNTGRWWSTATLLYDGTVLIAGGQVSNSSTIASSEIYNPSTGTFTDTGSLNQTRCAHTATLLYDGTVLVAGGNTSTAGNRNTAELYNPTTRTFSFTGSLNTARYWQTATLLSSGMVLVAGGYNNNTHNLISAELYDGPAPVTGYVDPKFIVVGVTYAPPGPSTNTFVQYLNSTFVGSTESLSNSFTSSNTTSVSLSFGFNIPMAANGKITDTFSTTNSETTKNTSTVTTSIQIQNGEKTFGTGDYFAPVDNDYDIIWVWLNPVAIFTISNNNVVWNGYGFDGTDQPEMDIVGIQLGYLNGDFLTGIPPDIQSSINRTWAANQIWPAGQGPALTSADLAQIASADPFSVSTYGPDFIGSVPPSPQTSDNRFTLSSCSEIASFDYVQAAPSQQPAINTCTLTYTNTSTQAQEISTTYSQTFSVDDSFSGSVFIITFGDDLKNSSTLTWTTDAQSSITTSTTSTASLSVQGPPCNNVVQEQGPCVPVYDALGNEPTQFDVYQDNLYGTFMFAPIHFY